MQVLTTSNANSEGIALSGKKLAIVHEIGIAEVPTATAFVAYVAVKYSISESGVWYVLKTLKRDGVVDFTEKGEEQRPLTLTCKGMRMVRRGQVGISKSAIRRDRGFVLAQNF